MAVKTKEILIPERHARLIIFSDDFGNEHCVEEPTHIATDNPLKPFPVGPAQIKEFESQKENIRKMMEERELHFLDWCMRDPQHQHHPKVLAHPDHPRNKGPK